MKRDDIRLLKIFEIPLTYYEVTKELIRKLELTGDVVFESRVSGNISADVVKEFIFGDRLIDDLVVIKENNTTRVITNKDFFRFPNNDWSNRWIFEKRHCKATSLDLSNFDTSNLTSLWGMFEDCQATSINLESFDTSNVTSMVNVFHSCAVKSLDLSNFETSKVTSMSEMFRFCRNLDYLNLSSFDDSNVKDMDKMFADCKIADKIRNNLNEGK